MIAGYAAVVASLSFVWQAATRARGRKPRLQVDFRTDLRVTADESLADLAGTVHHNPSALDWRINISVDNVGEVRVQLTKLDFHQLDDSGNITRKWAVAADVIGGKWIEPGETYPGVLSCRDFDCIDFFAPLEVRATVSPALTFSVTKALMSTVRLVINAPDAFSRAVVDSVLSDFEYRDVSVTFTHVVEAEAEHQG